MDVDQDVPKSGAGNPSATTRRRLVGVGAGLLGWATALQVAEVSTASAQQAPAGSVSDEIVVTLLGTGSPVPVPDRFGPATLVEAGGRRLLFDAGRGAPIRLAQAKVRLGSVNAVFITHYHSDHVSGLPDLWLSGFLIAPFGGRPKPMRLWGPTGITRLADNMVTTFGDDIRIRMAEAPIATPATRIEAYEFSDGGVVFDEDGLRVTSFEVDHGPMAKPAFGYRVDYAGRSVLISGDTRYNDNVILHGRNVDLLIHEVCAMPDGLKSKPFAQDIIALHTSPEEAGRVFSLTKPRMAAYTHVVSLGTPDIAPLSSKDIETQTRKTFDGPLVVGEDLTRFRIGDSIAVLRWAPVRQGY